LRISSVVALGGNQMHAGFRTEDVHRPGHTINQLRRRLTSDFAIKSKQIWSS
jgi:hypothetical protein